MVTEQEIALVRRSMETTDFDTIPELYHEDMELHETDPGGGVHKGVQAYIAYWRQLFEQIEFVSSGVDEILHSGDQVLAYIHGDVRDKSSGTTLYVEMGVLFGFRDGKVALVEPFLDRAQAYDTWRGRVARESDHTAVAPDLTSG